MNNKAEFIVDYKSTPGNIASWMFGLVVMAIGIVNTFWGNDPGYGIFISLLSFVYFPPATAFLKKISGIAIPLLVKTLLGVFILWTALGVAELFDKIERMMKDL